jgi:hypothetical protein
MTTMRYPLLKQTTSSESFYSHKDAKKTIITTKDVLCKVKTKYSWLATQPTDVDSTCEAMR